MKRLRSRRGFSLIEIIIAAVIVSIAAAMVVPHVTGVKHKAYEDSMRNTLRRIIQLQITYHSRYKRYATTTDLQTEFGFAPDEKVNAWVDFTGFNPRYGFGAAANHSKTITYCGVYYGRPDAVSPPREGKIRCNPAGVPWEAGN